MKLSRSFFEQPTLKVAQELLGKKIVFQNHIGIITETEAYIGQDDPACHAVKGLTPRTEVMFGNAGFSYVYMIYGMYFCLNIVTEKKDFPAAVLLRGIKINNLHLDGPGKLCRYLGITKAHNKIDLIKDPHFYLLDSSYQPHYKATPRIGIKKGQDRLWRFISI